MPIGMAAKLAKKAVSKKKSAKKKFGAKLGKFAKKALAGEHKPLKKFGRKILGKRRPGEGRGQTMSNRRRAR